MTIWTSIKSILIHEYQHKSTRVNTNQHESTRVRHESTEVRHESTRINTRQHESNTSQHESTRVNTNQHESDTSQHESTRVQHESTRVRHDSKRVHKSQLDHKIIIIYVFYLVKYDKSLIGLNTTFSHELEPGSKENQEQTGRNLDAIKVFTNNFSLLGVKYQFICPWNYNTNRNNM